MPPAQITWFLKANKKYINCDTNYINYDVCNDKNLMSPLLMKSVIKMLTCMNYNIQTYEFINKYENYTKWSIYFDIDDYDIFRKDNMKLLVNFTSGLYKTSSIYVKHLYDDADCDIYCDADDDSENEWEKIYKNKDI